MGPALGAETAGEAAGVIRIRPPEPEPVIRRPSFPDPALELQQKVHERLAQEKHPLAARRCQGCLRRLDDERVAAGEKQCVVCAVATGGGVV